MGRWDVFLSYSHKNEERAAWIVRALTDAGLRVWFDQQAIRPTDELFASKISEGVIEVSCLCILTSTDAADSEWVRKELESYLGWTFLRETTLLYLLIDDEPGYADAAQHFKTITSSMELPEAKIDVRIRSVADDSILSVIEELTTTLKPHASPVVLIDNSERIHRAKKYWRENNVMARLGWDMPAMEPLLSRLDTFLPPYPFDWRPDDQIIAILEGIFRDQLSGLLMSNASSQRAIIEILGKPEMFVGSVHHGSPVAVLYGMGIETRITEDLQASYYDVRARFVHHPSRDVLDLTVVLAAGASIARWSGQKSPEEVADAMLTLIPYWYQ